MSVSDPPQTVPVVVCGVRWEEASDGFVPSGAVYGGKTFNGEPVYIGRARLIENRNELTPGVLIPSEGHLNISYGTGVQKSKKYEVLVTDDPNTLHWVPCRAGLVPLNAVIGGIDCSYLEPLYIGRTRGCLNLGRTWRGQRFPVGPTNSTPSDPVSVTITSYDEDYDSSLKLPRRALSRETSIHTGHGHELESESREGSDGFANLKVGFPGKVHRSHKCLYIPYNDKEYLFREYEVLTLTATPASLATICKCRIRHHLLTTIMDLEATGPELLRCNATLLADSDDHVEKTMARKIDALPIPRKLQNFCKQGME